MSANTTSTNPVVQAIAAGKAPQTARLMAARGLLPLAADELLEVLVTLRGDENPEIVQAADETLDAQPAETLVAVASASTTSPAVLSYLAGRAGAQKEVHEAVTLNAATPDDAIVTLAAATSDGSLLELISINQQRLIRAPGIIEALLSNPARTNEAERRAQETKREFFEKERGAQQIADEMRARGMTAAAEFIESAESIGAGSALSYDDAWLLAQHIEVSDADIDDSWLPLERMEEFFTESEEQRAANLERVLAETNAESSGEVAPERISLIRRVMLMNVKDRVKLAMKGDREARSILIRDSNKVVATGVINNPRITDKEVESISAMRTVSDEVLRLIAQNRAWARNYSVIHNLARNPRTPIATAINVLMRLQTKDLQNISQNRNVSEAVRRQAQRLAQTRSGH
ncbi:MAG TPA: hypothetical protein VD835_08020 [Pyrinomonadaceae bacterium]|nr:hypothetical protein [Pyrinomonadaceae bacterium]